MNTAADNTWSQHLSGPGHIDGQTSRELLALRCRFDTLHHSCDPHRRGIELEQLVYHLLGHAGLDPRASYSLAHEQIDGSFILDAQVYLLEVKWTSRPLTREHADIFAAKLRRKGRTTMGLIVSIAGFSEGFLTLRPDGGTPYVGLDHGDLSNVFSGVSSLAALLRVRRRHLDETGECFARRLPT